MRLIVFVAWTLHSRMNIHAKFWPQILLYNYQGSHNMCIHICWFQVLTYQITSSFSFSNQDTCQIFVPKCIIYWISGKVFWIGLVRGMTFVQPILNNFVGASINGLYLKSQVGEWATDAKGWR